MTRWNTLVPYEEDEQMAVMRWLELHKVCWFHPANEGMHKVQYRKKQRKLGLKPGVPDILIFDPPCSLGGQAFVGTAIELKRRDRTNNPTRRQLWWLRKLRELGWYTAVCYGADETIDLLEKLGYGRGGSSERNCDRNRSHTVSEIQRANHDCQRGTYF